MTAFVDKGYYGEGKSAGINIPRPKGRGMLIPAMTEQLGGTVFLKKSPHPEFSFRFPPGEEQAW